MHLQMDFFVKRFSGPGMVLGQGGPQDLPEARRLYSLGAAQGDAEAQFNLGVMHEDGHGGLQDSLGARRLYGLAAAQGHAKAQFNLGFMHHEGQGGRKDLPEARRLYGLQGCWFNIKTLFCVKYQVLRH